MLKARIIYIFTLQFHYVISISSPTTEAPSFEDLYVTNAYFLRDYNTYLSEAEPRGYYAWGTTQTSASGKHIGVCLNHHQRLGVTF